MTEEEIDEVYAALESVLKILERLENIKIIGNEWGWHIRSTKPPLS